MYAGFHAWSQRPLAARVRIVSLVRDEAIYGVAGLVWLVFGGGVIFSELSFMGWVVRSINFGFSVICAGVGGPVVPAKASRFVIPAKARFVIPAKAGIHFDFVFRSVMS
jgi:hypothetical protein